MFDGRSDPAILADFSRRYGGQVNLDQVPVEALAPRNRGVKASSDPVTR